MSSSTENFLSGVFGLQGRHIFLTGASSGIGEHWANTMAGAGASTVALAARRTDRLVVLAERLSKTYPKTKFVTVALDVSDLNAIPRALNEAEAKAGGVTFNVLVNNAGVGPNANILKAAPENLDDTIKINVRGPFVLSQEFCKRLIQKDLKDGSIINVASIYGLRVGFNNGVYATSKAALIQMSKAMAIEVLSKGIRVNVIAPGYFRSEMTVDFYDSPAGQKYLQKIPSKRLGLLEEFDGALLLLASKASSNMTGSVVVVDGGHSTSSL